MNKQTNKLMTTGAIMATLATIAVPFGNVFAADTAPTWTNSSATIKRTIENAYGTINNTFTYAINASGSNPTGAANAPTSATIAFNDTYATQADVSKVTSIDFSGMTFTQVGDYSYTITETGSTNSALYPLDSTSYTAVISVRNNANLTGYVASLYIQDSAGDKLDTISGATTEFTYTSGPAYTNIAVTADASGNAADPEKCFDYTLTLSTADEYTVSTTSECTNASKVGNGDTISLKKDDTITIGLNGTSSEIPVGTTFSVAKKDGADYAGHTTSFDGTAGNGSTTKTMVATNNSSFNTSNKVAIDEHKESVTPTGAFMNISIYILLAIAGGIGIYFAVKKKNQKEA